MDTGSGNIGLYEDLAVKVPKKDLITINDEVQIKRGIFRVTNFKPNGRLFLKFVREA